MFEYKKIVPAYCRDDKNTVIPLCFTYTSQHMPLWLSHRVEGNQSIKNAPAKQGRQTAAIPLCFRVNLTADTSIGLKSLSDMTVAPVVPTVGSAHCSQE